MSRDQVTVARRPRRLLWLDLARTAALLAMIVFHSVRDMEIFGLVQAGTTAHGGWAVFARLIAGTFIFLSGLSLVLSQGAEFDRHKWLRRILRIAAAAALVTLATFLVFPDKFVYFGILHLIALASLLGALLLPLSGRMLALTAVAILCLHAIPHNLFATPLFGWTGLSSSVRPSLDHLPLIPWFAPFLAGMATAKCFPLTRYDITMVPAAFAKAISWAGRHSLTIYLVHQPLLLAIFFLAQRII